jgi:hypothetical protein
VFTSGRLDVYILVPMLWALYNAIPPLLFFVYFFTKGKVLQGLCSVMQVLGVILAAGEDIWGEKCYTQTHSPHINGIAYRDCTG